MEDNENDPVGGGRPSRARRTRAGPTSSIGANGGREREFTGNGNVDMGMANGLGISNAASGAAAAATSATEETDALLRKLRALW